jgi:hypothetical protein
VSDSPETDNLARGNHVVPTEFAQQLEIQRDEARGWAEAAWAKADRAEKMLRIAAAKADEWRECAEKLTAFVVPVPRDMADHAACASALAEFERLKESSK